MGAKAAYAVVVLSLIGTLGLIGSAFFPSWLYKRYAVGIIGKMTVDVGVYSMEFKSAECSALAQLDVQFDGVKDLANVGKMGKIAGKHFCQMFLGKRSLAEQRDMACSPAKQIATGLAVGAVKAGGGLLLEGIDAIADKFAGRDVLFKNDGKIMGMEAPKIVPPDQTNKCKTVRGLWYSSWALMFGIGFDALFSFLGIGMLFAWMCGAKNKGRYKNSYRGLAMMFLIIAPLLASVGIGMYAYYSTYLDDMMDWKDDPNLADFRFLGPVSSDDPGINIGWVVALVAVVIQLVCPCLMCAVAPSESYLEKHAKGDGESEDEDEEEPLMPQAFANMMPGAFAWYPGGQIPTHMQQPGQVPPPMQQRLGGPGGPPGAFVPPGYPVGVPNPYPGQQQQRPVGLGGVAVPGQVRSNV